MLTVQEHLDLAERNEQFADAIASLPQRFPEWEITALFYSALHYASAFLATQGHNPTNHNKRNDLVGNLTNAGTEYQNLYRLSLNTRYQRSHYAPGQADAIKTGPFHRVKEEMLTLLSRQL